MPAPNTIQFSLPAEMRERLESLGNGESAALTAKKLVLQALEAIDPTPNPLGRLEERLEKLEGELKALALQFSERVYELSQQAAALSPLESALGDLEKMACSMQVGLESRLSEIERRLDSIPAAVPTPTRLPKATKRKTQETPNSGETP